MGLWRSVYFWLAVNSAIGLGIVCRYYCAPSTHAEVPEQIYAVGEMYRAKELRVGDSAVDFTLPTINGSQQIALADSLGVRPIVLVFGSYTCPSFRQRAASLNKAYEKYDDKATFLFVYIREAHPDESGHIPDNNELGKRILQPKSLAERSQLAHTCSDTLRIRMPVVVDNMANEAATAYNAWPERLYVIDANGKVAHAGSGPGSVDVAAMAEALERMP